MRTQEAVLPARKYAIWAAAAFAIVYTVRDPSGAAIGIHNAAYGLADVADSLTTFVDKLAS